MGARRFPFPPLPLLVLGYLASRLPGLGRMPAFTDELLHLQWAEKVAGAGSWSSVVETLQWIFGPHGRWLQPVLAAPVVTWAADDLLAVRALMVAVGATGVVAAFRTAERCGGRGAAVITAILYTLCPFAVFHDRLALSDGLLCALTAWAVCLSMALAGAPGWNAGRTVGLALVLAAAIAAKLPGLLLLAFPPLALLLIGASWRRWLHGAVATGAALLSLLPFAGTLVRDSAQGPKLAGSLLDGGRITANLVEVVRWLAAYWTAPVLAAVAVAGVVVVFQRRRLETTLVLFTLLPLVSLAVVASPPGMFPRYGLPSTPPAMLLLGLTAARAAAWVVRRWAAAGVGPGLVVAVGAGLVLAPALRFDALLLARPAAAPLPAKDRSQYVTGLASGYGAPEIARVLREPSRDCAAGTLLLAENGFVHRTVIFYLARGPSAAAQAVDSYCCDLRSEAATRALAEAVGQGHCLRLLVPRGAVPPRLRTTALAESMLQEEGRLVAVGEKPGGRLRLELWSIPPGAHAAARATVSATGLEPPAGSGRIGHR